MTDNDFVEGHMHGQKEPPLPLAWRVLFLVAWAYLVVKDWWEDADE